MIKRDKDIAVVHQREYLSAENASHDKLVVEGFFPQGCTKDFKKVTVMDKNRNFSCFENWQEAVEALCK